MSGRYVVIYTPDNSSLSIDCVLPENPAFRYLELIAGIVRLLFAKDNEDLSRAHTIGSMHTPRPLQSSRGLTACVPGHPESEKRRRERGSNRRTSDYQSDTLTIGPYHRTSRAHWG